MNFPRKYERSRISAETLKRLLTDASKKPSPPSVYAFARGLNLHVDSPRIRADEETRALAAAHAKYEQQRRAAIYSEWVSRFVDAASELQREGRPVHRKSVQKRSGLYAFNGSRRSHALDEALCQIGLDLASAPTQNSRRSENRVGQLLESLTEQVIAGRPRSERKRKEESHG